MFWCLRHYISHLHLSPHTIQKQKYSYPCLLYLFLFILTDNERTELDFLLQFLLPWVCVFLPTWEEEFYILIWIFSSFSSFKKILMFFLVSNIHWDQVYYCNMCLWVLKIGFWDWILSIYLRSWAQLHRWWLMKKWEKENPILHEFYPNFKPLCESQLMWISLHFMVVLILQYEFVKLVKDFVSEKSTYWEQEFN